MAVKYADEVMESLQIIKRELTTGIYECTSSEAKYKYAKDKAMEHPSLRSEGEQSESYTWSKTSSSEDFNVRKKLKEFLPESIYDGISSMEFSEISRIMNASNAGVDGLGTLFSNSTTDHKTLAEFSVIEHVGDEESTIYIRHLKITAHAECSRVLFWHDNKMDLHATHKVSKFKLNNKKLLERHVIERESVFKKALAFLAASKFGKFLRF